MTALKKYKAVKELENLLSFCLQYTPKIGEYSKRRPGAATNFLFLKPLQIAQHLFGVLLRSDVGVDLFNGAGRVDQKR